MALAARRQIIGGGEAWPAQGSIVNAANVHCTIANNKRLIGIF